MVYCRQGPDGPSEGESLRHGGSIAQYRFDLISRPARWGRCSVEVEVWDVFRVKDTFHGQAGFRAVSAVLTRYAEGGNVIAHRIGTFADAEG